MDVRSLFEEWWETREKELWQNTYSGTTTIKEVFLHAFEQACSLSRSERQEEIVTPEETIQDLATTRTKPVGSPPPRPETADLAL